jgi:hypothetical protein
LTLDNSLDSSGDNFGSERRPDASKKPLRKHSDNYLFGRYSV